MPRLRAGMGQELCHEFLEGHFRFELRRLFANKRELVFVVAINFLGQSAIGSFGRFAVAHAFYPDVAPPDPSAPKERHRIVPPFFCCCRFKIQPITCARKNTILPPVLARTWGRPRGMYRCRTVHGEQPRSSATWRMLIGSPSSGDRFFGLRLAPCLAHSPAPFCARPERVTP
jgi:hypothetical protein